MWQIVDTLAHPGFGPCHGNDRGSHWRSQGDFLWGLSCCQNSSSGSNVEGRDCGWNKYKMRRLDRYCGKGCDARRTVDSYIVTFLSQILSLPRPTCGVGLNPILYERFWGLVMHRGQMRRHGGMHPGEMSRYFVRMPHWLQSCFHQLYFSGQHSNFCTIIDMFGIITVQLFNYTVRPMFIPCCNSAAPTALGKLKNVLIDGWGSPGSAQDGVRRGSP